MEYYSTNHAGYDTIEEINVNSKAEDGILGSDHKFASSTQPHTRCGPQTAQRDKFSHTFGPRPRKFSKMDYS